MRGGVTAGNEIWWYEPRTSERRAAMPAGTHLCALYSDPAERERVRFAFLREGLRNGDRCLCLAAIAMFIGPRTSASKPASSR